MITIMENLLQSLIGQQAKSQILTTTLQNYEGKIDYKKLEDKSDAFAALLKDAGCRRGDRIGCMTERMSSALISMLGIMKTGCVCVPVKSRYNREQIRSVMLETKSCWLLADESVSAFIDPLLFETGEISLGWLGDANTLPDGVVPEFVFKNIDQYAAKSNFGRLRVRKQVFRFILPTSRKPLEVHQIASSAITSLSNSSSCGLNQGDKFIFGFAEESMLSRFKSVSFIREMKHIYLSFWHEIEKENFRHLELQ